MTKNTGKLNKNLLSKENPFLKKNIDKVKQKGHQRMTVMIIPHGHDSSFHFQISLFSIVFFISLLISLISLAIFGIVKYNNTRLQIASLSQVYGKYFDEYIQMTSGLGEMKDDFARINENLTEIFSLIDGNDDELLKVPSEQELQNLAYLLVKDEEKLDKDLVAGRSYLSEIYEYRILKTSMQGIQTVLDTDDKFLDTRATIVNAMPFSIPMYSYNVTSSFGNRRSPTTGFNEFHDGIDLANPAGTPIYATGPGRVVRVAYAENGYGHHIVIQHEFGYYTLYGHCSKIHVRLGQPVQKGNLIGAVGATGNVTGPHLHYEVWTGDSVRTDPEEFLKTGIN